ncbi:MAG: hypothetical protein NEHIOOID_00687 [Holosporales bacterium]
MKKITFSLLMLITLVKAAEFNRDQTEYLFRKVISPSLEERAFNGGTNESKKHEITKLTFNCLNGQNTSKKRFDLAVQIMKRSPQTDFFKKLEGAPIEVLLAYAAVNNYHVVHEGEGVDLVKAFTERFSNVHPKYSYLKLLFPANDLKNTKEECFLEFYRLFKNDSDYIKILAIEYIQGRLYKVLNYSANLFYQKSQRSNAKNMLIYSRFALDLSVFAQSTLASLLTANPQFKTMPGVVSIKSSILRCIEGCKILLGDSNSVRLASLPDDSVGDDGVSYVENLNYLRAVTPSNPSEYLDYLNASALTIHDAYENGINHHIEEIITLAKKHFSEDALKELLNSDEGAHQKIMLFFNVIFNKQKIVPEARFKELKDRLTKVLFDIQDDYEGAPCIASFLKLNIAQSSLSWGADGGIFMCRNPNGRISIYSFDAADTPQTEETLHELSRLGLEGTPFHQSVAASQHQRTLINLEKQCEYLSELKQDHDSLLDRQMISTVRTSHITPKSGPSFDDQLRQEYVVENDSKIIPNLSAKDILNEAERNSDLEMDQKDSVLYETLVALFEEAEGARIKAFLINSTGELFHTFTFHGAHGENKDNLSSQKKNRIKRLCFEQWKIIRSRQSDS